MLGYHSPAQLQRARSLPAEDLGIAVKGLVWVSMMVPLLLYWVPFKSNFLLTRGL